jgi:hypothetical protein
MSMNSSADLPWQDHASQCEPARESKHQQLLIDGLKSDPRVWFLNTVSGGKQRRAVPDILGVALGLAFAVELKRSDKENATKLQRKELEEFAAAGGLALIARGKQGAEAALRAILGGTLEETRWLERVSSEGST